MIPHCRNLTVDSDYSYDLYPLISSIEMAGLVKYNEVALLDVSNVTAIGGLNEVVLSSYFDTDLLGAYTGIYGHMLVIGSERAFDEDIIYGEKYNNAGYFVNAVHYIAGKEVNVYDALTKSIGGTLEVEKTVAFVTGAVCLILLGILIPASLYFVLIKKKDFKR